MRTPSFLDAAQARGWRTLDAREGRIQSAETAVPTHQ
jgi:hypothetical protein